jgi:hypothetical protein
MQTANDFIVLNIREYLGNDNKRLGEDKLMSFYENYGFKKFDTRQTSTETEGSHELVQLLRLL